MRTGTKRMLRIGVLAAAGYAVWRAFEARKVDTGVTWQPQPFPYPPQPRHQEGSTDGPADGPVDTSAEGSWIEADAGACPTSHPVKAKLGSGIYHVPGGASYDRTKADRCYPSTEAAEADGLRASKV